MTPFASLLCVSVLFLTTGGRTGIGGAVRRERSVSVYDCPVLKQQLICFGWMSQMFPTPPRARLRRTLDLTCSH